MHKKVKTYVFVLLISTLFISLIGSSGCSKNDPTVVVMPDGQGETIDVEDIVINIPEASGKVVYTKSGTLIDASNTADGYIMVKHEGSTKRLKVKVERGDGSYFYDLNNNGDYEVYPLQMGNGAYTIKVYEQVEGTSYAVLYAININVSMKDTDRVFVFPNQYVWYTNYNDAVELSYQLCQNVETNQEKVDIIFDYIDSHIKYDTKKAKTVTSGYLPNVDETLSSGKGICFDYAALMAAMLRAHDIPTRLAIGNIDPEGILHAWNQIYIDGKWVWMDATFGIKNSHKESDYTKEREY